MDKTPPPIALEERQHQAGRLFSPSVARNRDPIAEVFGKVVPTDATILEIASGTGEHAAHLCERRPDVKWYPSDPNAGSRESIGAWSATVPDGRMAQPIELSTTNGDWWRELSCAPDVIVCINMIHIAPIEAMTGLIHGARELLRPDGILFLYGPFYRDGVAADGNVAFDQDLRRRDPSWGVRDLDRDVIPFSLDHGLRLKLIEPMPANNLSVVFEREK